MSQHYWYIAVLDLETSGLEPLVDEIIEIAIAKYDIQTGQKIADYNTLVKPKKEISDKVTHITGITNDMLTGYPDFAAHIDEIKRVLDACIVVGHNIAFDIRFLEQNNVHLPQNAVFDTYPWVQSFGKDVFESYSLEAVAKALGSEHVQAHRAYSDVAANFDVFVYLNACFYACSETMQNMIIDYASKAGIPLPFSKAFGTSIPSTVVTTHIPWSPPAPKYQAEYVSLPKEGIYQSNMSEDALFLHLDREATQSDDKHALILPYNRARWILQKPYAMYVHGPEKYLDHTKLTYFFQTPQNWNKDEFVLAIKLYLHFGSDILDKAILDIGDMPLTQTERHTIAPLCCQSFADDCTSIVNLKHAMHKSSVLVLSTPTLFAQDIDLSDRTLSIPAFEEFFIPDALGCLEKRIHFGKLYTLWDEIINLPAVGDDTDMITLEERLAFLLGMIDNKWNQKFEGLSLFAQDIELSGQDIHKDLIQLLQSIWDDFVKIKARVDLIFTQKNYEMMKLSHYIQDFEKELSTALEVCGMYENMIHKLTRYPDSAFQLAVRNKDPFAVLNEKFETLGSKALLVLTYGYDVQDTLKYTRPVTRIFEKTPDFVFLPQSESTKKLYSYAHCQNSVHDPETIDQKTAQLIAQNSWEKQTKYVVLGWSARMLANFSQKLNEYVPEMPCFVCGKKQDGFMGAVKAFESAPYGVLLCNYMNFESLRAEILEMADAICLLRFPNPNAQTKDFELWARVHGKEGIGAYLDVAVPMGVFALHRLLVHVPNKPVILADPALRKNYSSVYVRDLDVSQIRES